MRLRAGLVAALVLVLGACAPAGETPSPEPTDLPTTELPAPEPTPSSRETTQVPEPTQSPSATESAEEPAATPSEPEASPSGAPPSASPPASDWVAVDMTVANQEHVDAAQLPEASRHYLNSRLMEPCEVQFNIFAAHPDGYLVGDESGICAGAGLFVYGPDGGTIMELVEFSTVQPCSEFSAAGVPNGVPSTDRFPDGLVCEDGGRQNY